MTTAADWKKHKKEHTIVLLVYPLTYGVPTVITEASWRAHCKQRRRQEP